MNMLTVVLACLNLGTSLLSPGMSLGSDDEWVYIGKPVRLVSFVVDTDFPGEKKSWSPGHRSGFILLDEHSFTVSSTSPFNACYYRYDQGVLARTTVSDTGVSDTETKASKVKMDYRPALFASLNECVSQGLGDVVKELLSEDSNKPPTRSVQLTKLRATAELGNSWRALTRVTWLLHSLDGVKSTTSIVCTFRILLPEGKGRSSQTACASQTRQAPKASTLNFDPLGIEFSRSTVPDLSARWGEPSIEVGEHPASGARWVLLDKTEVAVDGQAQDRRKRTIIEGVGIYDWRSTLEESLIGKYFKSSPLHGIRKGGRLQFSHIST